MVRTNLSLHKVDRLLMIDDFGCNESDADGYKDTEKIQRRRRSTIQMLREIFEADIEVFDFMVEPDCEISIPEYRLRIEFESIIDKASKQIQLYLNAR